MDLKEAKEEFEDLKSKQVRKIIDRIKF